MENKNPMFSTGTSQRPVLRASAGIRGMEIDLSKDEEDEKLSATSPKGELVADLTQDGQQFVLCKGGRGGLGNRNFATAARQTPRFAQPGEPGDEGDFLLELRIVAEIGLVGYPNAGKSTLLTAISRARPKVAAYPFTTLHPQIGIVEYPDWKRLTVCDVPGLIEGAHNNVGLGHKFLRHIKRCKILVLLLDMAGTDGPQAVGRLQAIVERTGALRSRAARKTAPRRGEQNGRSRRREKSEAVQKEDQKSYRAAHLRRV